MAYDENIRIIAEELERLKNKPTGDTLPEVETTDEGKVLTVNSSGKWVAANPSSSYDLDYSTTEKDTGMKWIDGRPIYQKTFFGQVSEGTALDVDVSSLNIDYLISLTSTAYNQTYSVNGYYASSSDYLNAYLNRDGNELTVYASSSGFFGDVYVTIQYVKKSTSKKKGDK